jgi:ABC-type Fe3+-siderophore transport system permease subunit
VIWVCVLLPSLTVLHLLCLSRQVLNLGLAEDDVAAGLGSRVKSRFWSTQEPTTIQAPALVRENQGKW